VTESSEQDRSPWSRALGVISAIGPPITVVTGLLFYFGWARADAQASDMGLDESLFGYAAQDYILISINALYLPLICLLVVGVVWLALDRRLRRRIDEDRHRDLIERLAGITALLAVVIAALSFLLAVVMRNQVAIFAPYVMAFGVLVAAWGIRLRRHARAGRAPVLTVEEHAVETTFVLGLVTLLLFWGTAEFAQAVGRGIAASYEREVGSLPRAEVYSGKPLGIGVEAVGVSQVGTSEQPLYRYDGLRLLVLSGGRFFFLHDGWTIENGTVVVLPDDNSIRVEFGR
jgi:hypothetical protein